MTQIPARLLAATSGPGAAHRPVLRLEADPAARRYRHQTGYGHVTRLLLADIEQDTSTRSDAFLWPLVDNFHAAVRAHVTDLAHTLGVDTGPGRAAPRATGQVWADVADRLSAHLSATDLAELTALVDTAVAFTDAARDPGTYANRDVYLDTAAVRALVSDTLRALDGTTTGVAESVAVHAEMDEDQRLRYQ